MNFRKDLFKEQKKDPHRDRLGQKKGVTEQQAGETLDAGINCSCGCDRREQMSLHNLVLPGLSCRRNSRWHVGVTPSSWRL